MWLLCVNEGTVNFRTDQKTTATLKFEAYLSNMNLHDMQESSSLIIENPVQLNPRILFLLHCVLQFCGRLYS